MVAKAPPFTDEDRQNIIERFNAGDGLVMIAGSYHCRYTKIKEIIEAAGIKIHRSSRMNTPIECRMHDALKAVGIGFTTQVRLVERYIVDIKVNQAPVVIEADGMHHISNGARDKVRDAAHEAAGYRVLRFTGSEINTDATACVQRAIDLCGLVPDVEPVYDIRTKFSGPDHPRWNERLTLKCMNCEAEFVVVRKHRYRKFCKLSCYHEYIRKTGIFIGGRGPIHRPD